MNGVEKMNWLDICLLIVFILHIISGFGRGLFKQLFDIMGFFVIIVLSLWGSRRYSEVLAEYINPEDISPHHEVIQNMGVDVALEQAPQLIAGVITFLLLLLFLSLVFRFFSGGFRWVNRIPVIGFFNRLGGGFLGALVGAVFVYIIIVAVSLIPMQFFMDALEGSEAAFFADHYITPSAEELKVRLLNYYINQNG